jgi:hypothetical protein
MRSPAESTFFHEASGDKTPQAAALATPGGRGIRYARSIANAHHVS